MMVGRTGGNAGRRWGGSWAEYIEAAVFELEAVVEPVQARGRARKTDAPVAPESVGSDSAEVRPGADGQKGAPFCHLNTV
mgnify:CR=1 FL=1